MPQLPKTKRAPGPCLRLRRGKSGGFRTANPWSLPARAPSAGSDSAATSSSSVTDGTTEGVADTPSPRW